ncbi:MBL fold metallo-hydrolase [Ideonella sp. A 288]|uniref:MBL fold metallo-hydrolase n=1 Tax=Ideonella sp. A 288 TaxID=1962181 RepID=UPI0013030479|nr:MBL fold metallo-hydrolase [Ideonella sp. A 288]
MKIVVLRGGGPGRRRAPQRAGTRDRGVLALGCGEGQWVLINVSAAVAHQLDSDVSLDAHPGLGGASARAVVLTDAQVDHVGGLLSLRDGAPIDLYATPSVFESLTTALPVLPVLQHYCGVHWHVVPVAGDRRAASFRVEGMPSLEFTALATAAPALPHALGEHPRVGDSIALAVRDLATGQRVFCAPGLAPLGGLAFDWMREADCLLLDSPGEDESTPADPLWMDLLRDLPARHKVLFGAEGAHGGPAALAERGIAMAFDGMEIDL